MATYGSTASGDGPTATGSPAGVAGGGVSPTQTVETFDDTTVTRLAAPTPSTRSGGERTVGYVAAGSVAGLDGDSVATTQAVIGYSAVTVTRTSAPTTPNRSGTERSGLSTIASAITGLVGDGVTPTDSIVNFESTTVVRVAAPASPARVGASRHRGTVSPVDVTALLGDLVSPTQSTGSFNSSLGSGAVIPTSYFRKVEGRVLDASSGETISNGIYIAALDNFAVVGNVSENGAFIIYLLRQTYTQFILVADASENASMDAEYDYVWYESEGNPSVGTSDEYVELAFDTAVPETGTPPPTGLTIGGDLSFK